MVNFNHVGDPGYFSSRIASEVFGAEPGQMKPISLEFKAGSDHTIDGKRFDGELQIKF